MKSRSVKMNKRAILLFAAVTVVVIATAREVTREGVLVTMPDGKWKQWSGTCTGDWGWQRDGIGFSIGTRRYLKKDREWISTGDIYEISQFGDLQAEVASVMQRSHCHLVKADTTKANGGADILILEFEILPSKEVPSPTRTRVLYAFREALDHRSAVEIQCAFAEKQAALGRQIFGDALKSMAKEGGSDKIPEAASSDVSHR